MVRSSIMGKDGLTLAVIASLVMTAVAFFVDTPPLLTADAGICFPSPNNWPMPAGLGWIFNTAMIGVTALLLSILNKEYRIVPNSDSVFLEMFLILAVSNVWISGIFTASSIMAVINLACILILFSCYDRNNSSKDIFLIATMMSIGSMFQYAFIFIAPVFLIGTFIVKCFDIKVLAAYLMGLIAPYWIILGFGIVAPGELHFPSLSNIFTFASENDMFFGLLNVWLTIGIGILLSLANSMQTYAGNSKKRACNAVLNVLGIFILLCIIFDFANLVTYLATAYFFTAIQIGRIFELGNIRRPEMWLLGIFLIYLILFILTVAT